MTKPQRARKAKEEKSSLVFSNIQFGPKSYLQVRSEINQARLYLPRADSIAGLVCTTMTFQNTPEFKPINYVLSRSFLWVFNINI